MASIVKKKKKGNAYYYAVESARVNGKPRIVWQKYLGTIDNIINKVCNRSDKSVREVDIFNAGGVAAMLGIAQKLSLIEMIDEIVPKRHQGASIGQYIVLAAINRILDPCSMLQMPEWYSKCVLHRLWRHSPETFTSQMFWNHMDLITEDDIERIQVAISNKLMKEFDIDTSTFLYDTTNFFTYVATGNQRNTIAQRGRNKVKRNDLRQVGLALLVTKDFQIPLFHKVYQGNFADRGLFPQVAQELVEWRKKHVSPTNDITLVFDKGNISEDAMESLLIGGYHYVCAVPKTTDPILFSMDVESLTPVPGLPGVKAHSKIIEIWNKKHKAVLCYSESYFSAHMADLMTKLQKFEKKLHDEDLYLAKGPSTPQSHKSHNKSAIQARLRAMDASSDIKSIMNVKIKKIEGKFRLEYGINQTKLNELIKTGLGRTIILSDRLDKSENEIISAYRSQQGIEDVFKSMKNKDYLHWQPEFHWTDNKIRVHGLYCVIALLLATLAHREVTKCGLNLSLLEMIYELNEIREVALIYLDKKGKEKSDEIAMSKLNPAQKRLSEILDIPKVLLK